MIDQSLFLALISFYFVMYVTPGPNNAMVLSSGIKFGFLKTIPHMSGITIGHILQTVLVCLGLGKIFQMFPEIQNILKIICAIYLLYLGYKIIGCAYGMAFILYLTKKSYIFVKSDADIFFFIRCQYYVFKYLITCSFHDVNSHRIV